MLAVASLESNLYQLDTNVVNGAETSSLAHSDGNSHSLELWHKRLGHLNANSVKMLQSMVSGRAFYYGGIVEGRALGCS